MKISSTKSSPVMLFIIAALGYVGYLASCTQTDQVLLTNPNAVNSTDLVSIKVTTPPTIDGTIDAAWDKATKLKVVPTVPDPGNGLFTGYIGMTYPVTLRSLYDDTNIYFLAEYDDPDKSVSASPWYFDPNTKLWTQEPSAKTYNANGVLTRDGFGEDKIAMLWNIDKSTPKFLTQTCYASCHVFTPYKDNAGVSVSNANNGNHYTNGSNEKIDMWWGHLGRDVSEGKMDDNYQDYAGGPDVTNLVGGNANGRHLDGLVPTGSKDAAWPNRPLYTSYADGTNGPYNNRQTNFQITGGIKTTVPKYVVPGASVAFIKQSDIDNGTAKLITAIDVNGVITYNGGTIDPNVGSDYLRSGDPVYGNTAPKAIPSVVVAPFANGRQDITCQANYTGTGWVVEYMRALKTGDALKQDVDFSSKEDQQFGVAIWNRSNYQHGIQPNLVLKFK